MGFTLLADNVAHGQLYADDMGPTGIYPLHTSKCWFRCWGIGSDFGKVGGMDVVLSLMSKLDNDLIHVARQAY